MIPRAVILGVSFLLLMISIGCAFEVTPGVSHVIISPGKFIMGSEPSLVNVYVDEMPAHIETIDYEYAIGVYEVTNAEYAEFLNSVGVIHDAEGHAYIDSSDVDIDIELVGLLWRPKAGRELYPMREVSWYGAKAYCDWVGGRLPLETEWEYAARGWDSRLWPWGNCFLPFGEDPQNPLHPRCSYWWGNRLYHTNPVRPYPVGAFSTYPSPFGCQDMAGNVWEWTLGGYASYPGCSTPFKDYSRNVQRGGSWTNSDYNVMCSTRSPQPPYITDANLGFRVVWSDYQPMTVASFAPPRAQCREWIENFDTPSELDEKYVWWGDNPSFEIDSNNGWLRASLINPSRGPSGESMGMIRRDTSAFFTPGEYVDVTVRFRYARGDRAYARCSVGIAWGDTQGIVPGGRGADENFGYPWYLVANNSDTPDVWHEVTCEGIVCGGGVLCIGFGLWANKPLEASPPILSEHSMWVDWVRVRHSNPRTFAAPEVLDDGIYTDTLVPLHASWPSRYAYPIDEYQYAIGTSLDSLVLDWTTAGTATEATESGLNLVAGQIYYWFVKARSGAFWSEIGQSDGITVLDCAPPTIFSQPVGGAACLGQAVTLCVAAKGSSLSYQWTKDSMPVQGATAKCLTIGPVVASSAGSYQCVVSNSCGVVTSRSAMLFVYEPPTIVTQPQSVTKCEGQPVSMCIVATGNSLSYTWRKDGSIVCAEGGTCYSINSAVQADSGTYVCVASSPCASVTSLPAVVTVNTAPRITLQPVGQFVCPQCVATFCIKASGSPTPAYQWRRAGVLISGATGSCYTTNLAGAYSCVASNSCGSRTSNTAVLTVLQPVSIPQAKALADGSRVCISQRSVTHSAADFLYVEESSRIMGMRVDRSAHGLSVGDKVDVVGIMRTNGDRERFLEASDICRTGFSMVEAVGMSGRDLGGVAWNYNAATGAGQAGVLGGSGLNNIGLLVTVWGRVTAVGANYVYLDDGSALDDGTGNSGLRVICDSTRYKVGDYLMVTGISSCFKNPSGDIVRRILARSLDDLVKISP